MGIRLSDDEAWEFVAQAHTAILTTLRSDGWPVPPSLRPFDQRCFSPLVAESTETGPRELWKSPTYHGLTPPKMLLRQ